MNMDKYIRLKCCEDDQSTLETVLRSMGFSVHIDAVGMNAISGEYTLSILTEGEGTHKYWKKVE